jgi:hypothetical protein
MQGRRLKRNIGLWPVRPADILSAVCPIQGSGVKFRQAHRPQAYVPFGRPALARNQSTNLGSPTLNGVVGL